MFALFRARGWSSGRLGPWDAGYDAEAERVLAAGEWRVRLFHSWVDRAGRDDLVATDPDGACLCIVPAHRTSDGGVFLPLQDDRLNRLSLILSKAFLLAADTETTDETIRRQIGRRP
jgi:hypothetical protein